ncbi:uncharacterized protein LOC108106712 [Drosophila eugracilis]|uniref:uncharacterized protein LOC108106712 n=1 Tax=Drosophila eugracilis TaxID=29029 RepID=UPI001BDA5076|nr:uncharacterized protein LOC108106712 [Drosophila eugracilis]
MNILSALKTRKLNLQNTCTSYYDFLTCGYTCLDSLRCSTLPHDRPVQQELQGPPRICRRGLKYYDVDDKATEWYLNTRRSTAEIKPSKRKFCFKFRVPVRHALRRKDKAATYSLPGRRVSPEFLCLLKQHHARMRGHTQLPRKYLSRKPSFSYYKYDADAKRRHMRPGIDTAAPLEFSCLNTACTRHYEPCCPPKQESPPPAPLSLEDIPISKTKSKKKFSLLDENQNYQIKSKSKGDKEDVAGDLKPTEGQLNSSTRLHRIYASNPSLIPPLANPEPTKPLFSKSQTNLEYSSQTKPTESKSHCSLTPMEKVMNCPCPIGQPKWLPNFRNQTICPDRTARLRKSRDPRCIEFEKSPFFKAIQGTKYTARNGSKKPRNSSQTKSISDNKICSITTTDKEADSSSDEDHCEIKSDLHVSSPPENTFYESISCHRSLRPDVYDQNDIEIPPNRREASTGYKSFVRRSEKQKMIDQSGPILKCKRKKPPPYCYLWSAVDPDIRETEKRRLAAHKRDQRQLYPESNPYSYYWSKTNPDIRSQTKRRLKEIDSKRGNSHPPNISRRSSPAQSLDICTCSRSSIYQFVKKSSSDLEDHHGSYRSQRKKSKYFIQRSTRNGKEASDNSSIVWEEDNPPKKSHQQWTGLVSTKLASETDTHVMKKPRLLPRLHALAKRFLWSGAKGLHIKSKQSENELPRNSPQSRDSSIGGFGILRDTFSQEQRGLCSSSTERKITFRDQDRSQDFRGPRDPKFWAKQSQKENKYQKTRQLTSLQLSSGSGSAINKTRTTYPTNSCSEQPSCSTRPSKIKKNQMSYPRKSFRRKRSSSRSQSSSCGSQSNDHCLIASQPVQSACQAPQPLVPRAQREWEEHRERSRARKQMENCRPCTDYLLTSRPTDARNPDIRRGIVTYRNHEFSTQLSYPCLVKPNEHCPMYRDKENNSRLRKRRYSARCCDDSDVSWHSKSPSGSGRMRGGIDFQEDVFSSRMGRYSSHTFPTSVSSKSDSKKRMHSTKPSKSPMHLFCFD